MSRIFINPTKKLMPGKRSIIDVTGAWELYCVFRMGIFISVRWWCNSDCTPLETFNKITPNIAYYTNAIGCHKGFISIGLSNNLQFVYLMHWTSPKSRGCITIIRIISSCSQIRNIYCDITFLHLNFWDVWLIHLIPVDNQGRK